MQQISQILPQVLSKGESQIQEYKQPKTSEESGFEVAISKPRIINTPLEELKKALRQVFFLIGLRADQIPVEEEKAFLIQYIIENYGGHTADEITLAFKMAIQGKLKLDYKEVRSYGIFSPMYFTIVMDAYREWAKEQSEKLLRNEPERQVSEHEKIMINFDYARFLLKLIDKLPFKVLK